MESKVASTWTFSEHAMEQTMTPPTSLGHAAPLPPALLEGMGLGADPALLDHLQHSVLQMLSLVLERARHGESPLPARTTQSQAPAVLPRSRPALRALSSREREVLERIAAGDSNKHIARALDLSLHTVKRHVANILDKLDVQSRGQAAACWRAQA